MHRIDFKGRPGLASVDADSLKGALRQFASGVTIVTAGEGDAMYGITVSAFTSISVEPPIVMVAIGHSSPLVERILTAEHYAVNILSADQEQLSARFAASLEGAEKYRDIKIAVGSSGAPGIPGALAVLDCVLDQTLQVATHILMFGRVVEVILSSDSHDPLLYYNRGYHRLVD